VQISRLRRKLHACVDAEIIKTYRGAGYLFDAKVTRGVTADETAAGGHDGRVADQPATGRPAAGHLVVPSDHLRHHRPDAAAAARGLSVAEWRVR
jgi:DNA-binding winged helix-turn-helix (wHTH) protein